MVGCGKIARPSHGIGAEKLTNDEIRTFIRTHAPADVIAKLKKVMKRSELCEILDLFNEGKKLKGVTSTNTLLSRLGRSMAATRIQRTLRKKMDEGRFHMMNFPAVKGLVPPRRSLITGEPTMRGRPMKLNKTFKYDPRAYQTIPLNYRHMVRLSAMQRAEKEKNEQREEEEAKFFGSNRSRSSANSNRSNSGAGSESNKGARGGAAPNKGFARRENAEARGPSGRFAGPLTNKTPVANIGQGEKRKIIRKRANRKLMKLPVFYGSQKKMALQVASIPTRSIPIRTNQLPISERQRAEIKRRKELLHNLGFSSSSDNNRKLAMRVRANMPEKRKVIGVSMPNMTYGPRKPLTQRPVLKKRAIRSRLVNMMYHINRKNLLKMTPADLRVKLAEKMVVEPSNLPMKLITKEINLFLPKTMQGKKSILKVGAIMRRREPQRFHRNMMVTKRPIQLGSSSNNASSMSESNDD
jgi:hypothetical protein